jgi:hypothetical protein
MDDDPKSKSEPKGLGNQPIVKLPKGRPADNLPGETPRIRSPEDEAAERDVKTSKFRR